MFASDSAHLRMLWSFVEANRRLLDGLSDEAVNFWLVKHIKDRLYLTEEEAKGISRYISERMTLIRDLIESS